MAKQFSIELNEFYNGIGQSPFVGNGNVRNVNTTDRIGAVYPNYRLKQSGTSTPVTAAIDDMIIFDDDVFALTSTGNLLAGSWTADETGFASGKMEVWRDYLVGCKQTTLKLRNTSGTVASISSVITTGSNAMCVVLSDALYIISDDNISKLSEADGATFAPGTPASYDLEVDKLKLPTGVKGNCVTTWNNLLVIGGDDGNLYTWNGVSDYFNDISKSVESEVQRLITVNRRVYAQLGNKGDWYIFDGISLSLVRAMPYSLFRHNNFSYTIQPRGVAEVDGKIYFGMNSTIESDAITGVYSLDLTNYSLQCEDQAYSLDGDDLPIGSSKFITLGAMVSNGDDYYVGVMYDNGVDSASYKIDEKSTANVYEKDSAYIETQLFDLTDDANAKRTLSKSTVIFAEALVADDSLKVYYREYIDDSWTLHQTIDTVGDKKVNLTSFPALDSIQLKIVLNNTIKLRTIILK